MKILVTGATGFIASHLIPSLITGGHTVGALFRDVPSDPARQERLATLTGATMLPHKPENLPAVVAAFGPEVCIHLAGRSQVRESIEQPALYQEANYGYTVALLEALRRSGCRRFVHASTVMVYGKDAPLPYREDALGSMPASPYGASKLAAEFHLNTYHALHGLETINLRLFSVYGAGLNQYTVPHLIASAILAQRPFTIFGDGSSQRDYIDVQDVVRALEIAALGRGSCPAVNIGTGVGTSLLALVNIIEQCLNKRAVLVHKPAIEGELPLAIPDVSRARQSLGFEAEIKLEGGMKRMAEWFFKKNSI